MMQGPEWYPMILLFDKLFYQTQPGRSQPAISDNIHSSSITSSYRILSNFDSRVKTNVKIKNKKIEKMCKITSFKAKKGKNKHNTICSLDLESIFFLNFIV